MTERECGPVQGVRGMRIGGQRKLIVPPELAYGKKGIGEVPPDATLEFEVTCGILVHICLLRHTCSMLAGWGYAEIMLGLSII